MESVPVGSPSPDVPNVATGLVVSQSLDRQMPEQVSIAKKLIPAGSVSVPTLTPIPTSTWVPTLTPIPTIPPPRPSLTPRYELASEPFRSTMVPALVIGSSTVEALRILRGGKDGVTSQYFMPGVALGTAYRIEGLNGGEKIHRTWIRDGVVVAESQFLAIGAQSVVVEAEILSHLVAGGSWVLAVFVEGSVVAVQPFAVDTQTLTLGRLRFSTDLTIGGRPTHTSSEFPSDVRRVIATFDVYNASENLVIRMRWVHNGAVRREEKLVWPGRSGPGASQLAVFPIEGVDKSPLESGDWRFVVEIDGEEVLNELFKVAVS